MIFGEAGDEGEVPERSGNAAAEVAESRARRGSRSPAVPFQRSASFSGSMPAEPGAMGAAVVQSSRPRLTDARSAAQSGSGLRGAVGGSGGGEWDYRCSGQEDLAAELRETKRLATMLMESTERKLEAGAAAMRQMGLSHQASLAAMVMIGEVRVQMVREGGNRDKAGRGASVAWRAFAATARSLGRAGFEDAEAWRRAVGAQVETLWGWPERTCARWEGGGAGLRGGYEDAGGGASVYGWAASGEAEGAAVGGGAAARGLGGEGETAWTRICCSPCCLLGRCCYRGCRAQAGGGARATGEGGGGARATAAEGGGAGGTGSARRCGRAGA